MEQLVDNIITCNIEEINKKIFPMNQRFGLKVYSNNVLYEFILHLKSHSDKLLVIGAGFIPEEKIETFRNRPVFSRISWKFEQSTLYYNDPTRNIKNVDLRGGWGIGTQDNWYLEEISKIIKIIAEKIYEYPETGEKYDNLMFYGSSMGGFMSLILATFIRNSVAIAEIPQLELREMRTNWPPLENQLFNGLSREEINEKYSYRLNVLELIKKEKYIPNAFLLLDCSSNNDFNKQFKPFFDKLNELPYLENNNRNKIKIRIDGKNLGHHQMPYADLFKTINDIELLMDSSKNKFNTTYRQLSPIQEKELLKYTTGRIDIINYGKQSSVKIMKSSDKSIFSKKIDWIKPEEGGGITIRSIKGSLDLKIKCINDGNLKIFLRSMYFKGTGKKMFPIYIDFTRFTVNNKEIFDTSEVVWHNEPFIYTQEVKNNEILELHMEWLPFNNKSSYK